MSRKNLNDPTKRVSELVAMLGNLWVQNQFTKSDVFLYTNNELSKREIKKTIPLQLPRKNTE